MKHFIAIITFFSLIILSSCKERNEPSTTTTKTTTPTTTTTTKKDYTLGSVTDICGNKYTYINFNGKTWMAQNMRCNKYDTKSEQSGKTLSTSTKNYAPCYIDASAKYNWDEESKKNGTNLTDEQILQLGYLYSWSAAVGLKSYDEAKEKTYFSYTRQGICPNGWHIPTKSDWVESETNGKKLKSTTGWYNGDSEYKAGSDSYGFSALPAGYCSVSSSGSNYIKDLGTYAYFWTVDPEVTTGILGYKNSSGAFARLMGYSYDELFSISHTKTAALSVRCVKDEYQMSKVNLSLDKTEISIQAKTNTTITATTNTTDEIVWTTSNANIATIKIDGKKCTINGIAVGEVEIKAEVAGVEAVCKVRVLSKESQTDNEDSGSDENIYDDIKSITLNKSELQLAIGQSETLVATVTNTSDIVVWAPIEWTVYDNIGNIRPSYGSDVNKIEITGVATGEAKIKASVAGKEAVCVVKVLPSDKVETPLVASTPGMFTVVFKVPELQCYSDLLIGFHSSSINDNDPVAMELDAPYEGWFKVVIPAEYTIGKLCPRYKNATIGTWDYRAMGYTIIEGEASDVVAGGDPAILLREGAISHTVYVEVISWAKNPCDDIQGGVGTFTIKLSDNCNANSYDKVIFTGNFNTNAWGESDRIMTNNGDGSYSWTGEYPDHFMYKVILQKDYDTNVFIGPRDSWKFDGSNYSQEWECEE